jgi:DUF917 family protein
MSPESLGSQQVTPMVWGGCILGGGGGGEIEHGLALGRVAQEYGRPVLADIDEVADGDLLTVSIVGAPSVSALMEPECLLRSVKLAMEKHPRPIVGFIANEVGAVSVVNGWLQSAYYGLPVVDAPCNGRAHPYAEMGAMGLSLRAGFISLQAAVGRDGTGQALELTVEAPLGIASSIVRSASTIGGSIAVARNPVEVAYVREHAAVGALRETLRLGEAVLSQLRHGPLAVARSACEVLGGNVAVAGEVTSLNKEAAAGFDRGRVRVDGGGDKCTVSIVNEYVALSRGGERIASFPDLIMAIGEDARPVTSAQLRVGEFLHWIVVPRSHLKLGAGMRDSALLLRLEETAGDSLQSTGDGIRGPN